MAKMTITKLRTMKTSVEAVTWVTAYDYPQGRLADEAGMDMILVGDSAGNTTHGYESTIPMTMEQMIDHAASVARGAKNAFLVGDMPFMSYQVSNEEAVANAGRFIRVGMDAIKLEGDCPDRVAAIDQAGILVIGHLGLTPQSKAKLGGYRVQGKTQTSADVILKEAFRCQEAGACALLLEAMPPRAAGAIAHALKIPVYGIGAGDQVDGQLLIIHDILGLSFEFKCKFAKKYFDGEAMLRGALKQYATEVRNDIFPAKEHFYEEDHEAS